MQCTLCGQDNRNEARFCGNCGVSVQPSAQQRSAQQMPAQQQAVADPTDANPSYAAGSTWQPPVGNGSASDPYGGYAPPPQQQAAQQPAYPTGYGATPGFANPAPPYVLTPPGYETGYAQATQAFANPYQAVAPAAATGIATTGPRLPGVLLLGAGLFLLPRAIDGLRFVGDNFGAGVRAQIVLGVVGALAVVLLGLVAIKKLKRVPVIVGALMVLVIALIPWVWRAAPIVTYSFGSLEVFTYKFYRDWRGATLVVSYLLCAAALATALILRKTPEADGATPVHGTSSFHENTR